MRLMVETFYQVDKRTEHSVKESKLECDLESEHRRYFFLHTSSTPW